MGKYLLDFELKENMKVVGSQPYPVLKAHEESLRKTQNVLFIGVPWKGKWLCIGRPIFFPT